MLDFTGMSKSSCINKPRLQLAFSKALGLFEIAVKSSTSYLNLYLKVQRATFFLKTLYRTYSRALYAWAFYSVDGRPHPMPTTLSKSYVSNSAWRLKIRTMFWRFCGFFKSVYPHWASWKIGLTIKPTATRMLAQWLLTKLHVRSGWFECVLSVNVKLLVSLIST